MLTVVWIAIYLFHADDTVIDEPLYTLTVTLHRELNLLHFRTFWYNLEKTGLGLYLEM